MPPPGPTESRPPGPALQAVRGGDDRSARVQATKLQGPAEVPTRSLLLFCFWRTLSPTQPAAALVIALRARLWVSMWIYLKIDGASPFSRRRRTFALGQDSTQQAETRMSRSANVGAFKRRKANVRTLPGPIASALALRNHPESSSAPADRGGQLSKAIRSEGLCCDGQPKREPG